MRKLEVKIRNLGHFRPEVIVDGKLAKLKKNKFGNMETTIETEKQEVSLQIRTQKNEYSLKGWFWLQLLYFIVSFFGIFDFGFTSNVYQINYAGKIALNEEQNTLDLMFQKREKDAKAVICKEGNFEDNESNIYLLDDKIKKRKKIMLGVKISTWILLVISIILIIIL